MSVGGHNNLAKLDSALEPMMWILLKFASINTRRQAMVWHIIYMFHSQLAEPGKKIVLKNYFEGSMIFSGIYLLLRRRKIICIFRDGTISRDPENNIFTRSVVTMIKCNVAEGCKVVVKQFQDSVEHSHLLILILAGADFLTPWLVEPLFH